MMKGTTGCVCSAEDPRSKPAPPGVGPVFPQPSRPNASTVLQESRKRARDAPVRPDIGISKPPDTWDELMEVAKKHKNIMTDISAWQTTAHESYSKFAYILRKVADAIGADKIIFGTDAPTFSYLYSENDWVEMVKDLCEKPSEEHRFTREEVDAILHGNAARVLGI